jgi:hypothetical protein
MGVGFVGRIKGARQGEVQHTVKGQNQFMLLLMMMMMPAVTVLDGQ